MKTTPAVIPVLALAISMIARFSLNAEDKDSAEARNARCDQLKHQIADYYAVESPWKGADVELEGTLLHLMGAEVGIWKLRDNLKDRNDDNYSEASNIGMPLHEEILATASIAVSRLRARPNPRLLKLLIAHLEAYPYDWSQEGYEDLLPNLKKLQNTRKK
jgi:hypothetical protein